MSRKLGLPVTDAAEAGALPAVDAVRKQLGGRASTEHAGSVVAVRVSDGGVLPAVVLFSAGDERHVFTGNGQVRRTRASQLERHGGEVPAPLRRVAADATVFATLSEGDRVRYADPLDGVATGTLVEKCRYGALVLREADETVLGVGFSRVWPMGEEN